MVLLRLLSRPATERVGLAEGARPGMGTGAGREKPPSCWDELDMAGEKEGGGTGRRTSGRDGRRKGRRRRGGRDGRRETRTRREKRTGRYKER